MATDRSNPSTRELLVFVLLWAVFCALIGLVAAHRAGQLLYVSVFVFVACVLAIVFDRETPMRARLRSLSIPAMLVVLWLAGGGQQIFWILAAIGAVGTSVMLASRRLALLFHRFWTDAAGPIGWTVSTVLLALVYFLVITPIGLMLRLFGHDPMQRGFERGRGSYWAERPQAPETRRYFRQF
ncbi:MAG: SxtJ family membrane protein [Planctomycetota bacterium]|jgi:hypothetical protein